MKTPLNYEAWFKSAIAVLSLLFVFISVWSFVKTSPGVDFYISWIGVLSMREHNCVNFYDEETGIEIRDSFYKRSLEKSVPPRQKMVAQCWQDYEKIFYKGKASGDRLLFFFNTPFLYTCMQLFVSGNYEKDLSLYYLVQIACFIFFIMTTMHLLKFPFISILYPVILFSVFYGPFLSDMRVGNVVLMQLGFIGMFLVFFHMLRKKDVGLLVGGAVLGLMVFFKPNMIFIPFMLIIGWLVLKQYRQVILSSVGMIGGTIAVLLSDAISFSTFRVWYWWFKSACNVSELPYVTVGEGNFALSRVLLETFGVHRVSLFLLFISITTILAIAYIRFKHNSIPSIQSQSQPADNMLLISIGCLLYLLCAPLVWNHYYMLAIPALIYLARPIQPLQGTPQAIMYSMALISYLFISLASRSDMTGFSITTSAFLCNIGTICLMTCLISLWYAGTANKSAHAQTRL